MQDATHCGTKMRNRLLRSYAAMPMGKKQVAVAHLKILIQDVPKMTHGLVYSDISPDDRQNFDSLHKCMSIRTRNSLRDFIPDSEATEFNLQLCSEITSSLMDHDTTPHERIELIFHAIYFLRIWRKWILSSQYNLKENFITVNCYMCIEVNAANLLNIIRQLRDEEKPELFLTTLFDSQACERAFRQFRSMGTTNFTKVNFSLYELLHMTRRLEVQNDILYTKLASFDIKLPKLEKSRTTTKIYALPSEEEIAKCLNRAKRFALDDASKFGMQLDGHDIDTCELPISKKIHHLEEEEVSDNESEYDDDDDEYFIGCDPDVLNKEDVNFEFPENDEFVKNNEKFVTMKNDEMKLIRKSTLVWLLSQGTKKISSDRLIRVQQKSGNCQITEGISSDAYEKIHVSEQIKIGDWCFFRNNETDANEIVCVGLVVAFKFGKGRTVKDKQYKGDLVDLKGNLPIAKELHVLSSWYVINDKRHLTALTSQNHRFIPLVNYIATVCKPLVDRDTKTIYFDEKDFKEIEDFVLKLL